MATVSIKDVAARAGVSLGTVSNVLNRPAAVRAATRAGVEAAIAELRFVPNASARQLAAGRSRTIAYVVLDATDPFFTDVARGIEEVARPEGLALFICNSDQDADREDQYLEQLTQLRARGVLITAMDYANPRLQRLRDAGVPVVLVDGAPDDSDGWCTVGVDDLAGGELAEGRRAGERPLGLSRRARPTGVFCANDLLALGLLQHLTQHEVRVPDDVAIVGYDDIEFASAAAVPLTSVSQPRHLLGQTAARLLADEADRSSAHEHQHVVFPPQLVARASTAAPVTHRRRA
jgi:LacI family transcriptional regulator